MAVEFRELKVQVPTEFDDVMQLFVELARTVRQGGNYVGLVDDLIKAIDGVSSVPAEARLAMFELANSVAVRGVEIAQALTAPKGK